MSVGLRVEHLALELTGRCQLVCSHCYADSSPRGTHGAMTSDDWRRLMDSAVACGVTSVQFIGGEPTLHPDFGNLLDHALSAGLRVEVFTNLVRVHDSWWRLFSHPRASVATSYYTPDAAVHDSLTRVVGSHARTRVNMTKAVGLGVRLRVAVVDLCGDAADAVEDLRALGVLDVKIGSVQAIGRAALGRPTIGDLCGACGRGRAAVNARGDVTPCVMARWIILGNVLRDDLRTILLGVRTTETTAGLRAAFAAAGGGGTPDSDDCAPKEQGRH